MKFHRLMRAETEPPEWFLTQAAAKAATKEIPKHLRERCYIDEVDVPTTKEGILNMLSYVGADFGNFTVVRSFGLTARGALEEVKE